MCAYEVPDWILPRLAAAFGPGLPAEMAALSEPAPLDLRVNILKTDRTQAVAALAREQLVAAPTRFSPWGLRLAGRQSVTQGAAFRDGLVEIQDEGQPIDRADRRCPTGNAGAGLLRRRRRQNPRYRNDDGQQGADCRLRRFGTPTGSGGQATCARAGVHNAETHLLAPGDKWTKRQAGKFDRVLVDAPLHRHRHLAPQPGRPRPLAGK